MPRWVISKRERAHSEQGQIHSIFWSVDTFAGRYRKAAPLSIENQAKVSAVSSGCRKLACGVLISFSLLLVAACGGQEPDDASGDSGKREASSGAQEENATGIAEETTVEEKTEAVSGESAELARAGLGEREIVNMLPADGKKPDTPQPLPDDPPIGIEVYPATTNRTVDGPIEYDRNPPTNGNHAPLWQNCGFYTEPIQDRHALHSMDHGVVWVTHRPDLPTQQVEVLRTYGNENYVIVSPYPGQDAPATVTSWRVQLELDSADDPRLEQFVDQFKISELAPLSGNRCTLGVGNPEG